MGIYKYPLGVYLRKEELQYKLEKERNVIITAFKNMNTARNLHVALALHSAIISRCINDLICDIMRHNEHG
jgi:hypothetical protein